VGGRPSVLRVVLAIITIAALATATWLGVVGRRQSNRASSLRQANAAAVARNRALSAKLSGLTVANSRAQGRIARIEDDRGATAGGMDSVVGAWNDWLTANNALIETANGFVDHAAEPSGAEMHAALDPRLRTITAKEAAFRAAIVKFAAAAAKARHDASSAKP